MYVTVFLCLFVRQHSFLAPDEERSDFLEQVHDDKKRCLTDPDYALDHEDIIK